MSLSNVCLDDLAVLLWSIRKVPEEQQDSAWDYIANRLHDNPTPTVFEIKRLVVDVIERYGADHWWRMFTWSSRSPK